MRNFFIPFLLLMFCACGGRMPATRTTTKLIRNHFNDYGKKYETGVFGKKKVTNVELLKADELHKHLISVVAFITMSDSRDPGASPDVHKVRVTLEKGPFGWRYVAWENLGGGYQ